MNTICIDLETDNVDPLNPKLVGGACAISMDGELGEIVWQTDITQFKVFLESPNYLKICHNLKFELAYLKSLGINMCPPYYDTMVACWLLGMGKERIETSGVKRFSYSLKNLAELHLGYTEPKTFKQLAKEYTVKTPTGKILKSGKEQMKKRPAVSSEIPVEILSAYCKKDVEMTMKLYELTEPLLREKGLDKLFHKVEMPLIPIFATMEKNGLLIDKEYLENYAEKLKSEISALESQMEEMV